jgi:regulatory protein
MIFCPTATDKLFKVLERPRCLLVMKIKDDRIWHIALGLLARRNHTAFELERKLLKRGFDQVTVQKTVAKCSQMQFVDDKVSGRIYLSELVRKGYGPHRIKYEMSQKGLEENLIDELFLEKSIEKNERAMCEKVLLKKIKTVSAKKDSKKVKVLLYRFLLSRGFSRSVILDLIGECHLE